MRSVYQRCSAAVVAVEELGLGVSPECERRRKQGIESEERVGGRSVRRGLRFALYACKSRN